MTIFAKLVSAGLTVGTIGGTGYLATYILNQDTLGKVLENKGDTLLSFDTGKKDDAETWKPIVLAYSKSTPKFEGVTITISTGSPETPSEANINALKEACSKAISSTNYEKATLLVAEQFCVTPKTVTELLIKNRVALNSKKEGGNAHDNHWNTKVNEYLSAKDNEKIDNIKISKEEPNKEKGKRDQLKSGCEELGKQKTYEPNFHTNSEKFEKWCSINKGI